MAKEIITIHLTHDLDIVLAHKYTIQVADFLNLSLSDHTQFATAISEISRNCLEYAGQGTVKFEIETDKDKNYLQATITDKGTGIPPAELEKITEGVALKKFGRGNGILYSRRLTDKLQIISNEEGTSVKLCKEIPKSRKQVRDEELNLWRTLLENDTAVSPYEEIKKRNQKLMQLTEELQKKNNETERQLEEIKRLNAELTESQHREEEGNEIFKFITENVPQIIYRLNEKGELHFLNGHLKNYLGPVNGNSKLKFHKFIHPDEINEFKIKWQQGISQKTEFELINRIKRHDGVFRWHKSAIKPIYDVAGKLLMWIGTSVDIDDQKKWSEELETTVSNRTRELLLANMELSRSNLDLEQYAYIASHDLKEPIRMVSNFTSLLTRKYRDSLDVEAKEFISYIEEGAQRMQSLVNDLLKYSKVSRHEEPVFSKVDCNKVLNIVRKNLEEKIEIHGAQIYIEDELPVVPGVESMLVQLFQNLVDNALKFKKSFPEIHISAVKEEGYCHFQVRDNGIGIGSEFHDKVFVIFQRLHARDAYEGTGMGLAICKKIVEYHGGKIWVDKENKTGTIFHFTLAA